MSATFTDDDLQTWEAYASGGNFGLSVRPKIVFHCVSDPARRPRFVQLRGDEADAQALVEESPERLKDLLRGSKPLD